MYCLEIYILILKTLKHKKENQEMKTKIQWVIPGMEADSIFNTIITINVTILQK